MSTTEQKKYALSPTALALHRNCKRCFWLAQNAKIHRPRGPFPTLPSGIDRVAKLYLNAYRSRRELPPELLDLPANSELFPDIKRLVVFQSNFGGLRWTCPRTGCELKGALDDIVVVDGRVSALDLKTNGFGVKPETVTHYEDQLAVYNWLLHTEGFLTNPFAFLLFWVPQEVLGLGVVRFKTVLIQVPVRLERAKELFYEALECLRGPLPRSTCEFCCRVREEDLAEVRA